jgi:hypothetical protein
MVRTRKRQLLDVRFIGDGILDTLLAGRPVAAAAGGLDLDEVARCQVAAPLRGQGVAVQAVAAA